MFGVPITIRLAEMEQFHRIMWLIYRAGKGRSADDELNDAIVQIGDEMLAKVNGSRPDWKDAADRLREMKPDDPKWSLKSTTLRIRYGREKVRPRLFLRNKAYISNVR
jgi:hypothetical protein